jgi:hypothetical protein
MIARRLALAGVCLAGSAMAEAAAFPSAATAAGRRLVLNGSGARRAFGVEVYRAALYLEVRARDAAVILDSPGVKLLWLRYRRDVPLAAVTRAWDASFTATCSCPVPETLRNWLRLITAGDEERYVVLPDGAEVSVNGGAPVRIAGAVAARTLLATFIGEAAPTEALRRGLLGAG